MNRRKKNNSKTPTAMLGWFVGGVLLVLLNLFVIYGLREFNNDTTVQIFNLFGLAIFTLFVLMFMVIADLVFVTKLLLWMFSDSRDKNSSVTLK